MNLDKKIWMYWHQGFENSPELVQKCTAKWTELNPSWEVVLLTQKNLSEYLDALPIPSVIQGKMLLAHKSDLIRTQLLVKYGGVWADPTTYPLQKLDDWLPAYMTSGLFMFQNPGRDRVISNWFIAADKNNSLLAQLFTELCAYWSENNFKNLGAHTRSRLIQNLEVIINRNTDWPLVWFSPLMTKIFRIAPYLIYHYKFYQLVKNNLNLGRYFNEMPVFVLVAIIYLVLAKPF